mmetsp:Transcript_20415/g.31909  ORF Transcript_20415/g.31909 Transcript_20415/m.31909 type:complete len:100 (-) Transcript_20415:99-398(-)
MSEGADAEGLEAFYQLREEIMTEAAKLQRKVGGLQRTKSKPPPLNLQSANDIPLERRSNSKSQHRPGEAAVAVRGDLQVASFDVGDVEFRRTRSFPIIT